MKYWSISLLRFTYFLFYFRYCYVISCLVCILFTLSTTLWLFDVVLYACLSHVLNSHHHLLFQTSHGKRRFWACDLRTSAQDWNYKDKILLLLWFIDKDIFNAMVTAHSIHRRWWIRFAYLQLVIFNHFRLLTSNEDLEVKASGLQLHDPNYDSSKRTNCCGRSSWNTKLDISLWMFCMGSCD